MSESASTGLNPQPTLKKNKSTGTMATTNDSSTLAPSVGNTEDLGEKSHMGSSPVGSRPPSPNAETAGIEKAVADLPTESQEKGEVNPEGGEDDEIEYPGPLALTLITIALSLAVFLVALVGAVTSSGILRLFG